jgi:hypothetical protein
MNTISENVLGRTHSDKHIIQVSYHTPLTNMMHNEVCTITRISHSLPVRHFY